PIAHVSVPKPSLIATVGDTDSTVISIRNTGLAPLAVQGLASPNPRVSLGEGPAFNIPAGSRVDVRALYAPRTVADSGSTQFSLGTDDPYSPLFQPSVSLRALGLDVHTQALTTAARVPLGQSVTIQVIPEPGHRVERGHLFFRSKGEPEFVRDTLVAIGGAFI